MKSKSTVGFAFGRQANKVAGRERLHEEATRAAPEPAEPHGPRRCGGPEHSVGLSQREAVAITPAYEPSRILRLSQESQESNRLGCEKREKPGHPKTLRL